MGSLQADAAKLEKEANRLRRRIEELRNVWKDQVAQQFISDELEPLLEACSVAARAIAECDARLDRVRRRLQMLRELPG